MTAADLLATLAELMALPAETEWVEFKEAKTTFDPEKLGNYFSALSNEANLKGQPWGWLVFGVTNKVPRQIVGTQYKAHRPALDALKKGVADQTSNRVTFEEIYEASRPEGRVLLFQIPPAPRGMPVAFKGHYYGREGESLGPLSIHEIEQIRKQETRDDWSAHCCQAAACDDLDPEAIAFARQEFKKKHPDLAGEADRWNDLTFLNKAKVCINGQITRTAIILLGKNEAEHYLSPGIARITWVLKDEHGIEKDYQHFGPPLILAVDRVFAKVRNLTYRYLPNASLFPTEITQYDAWVIRETLHNCIAHQDYSWGGKINVVEEPESLLFTNVGEFLPGSVEEAIIRDAPPELYRNPFLAHAMVNLNMIDTIGSGIKRMFTKQRQRNFPMPDYDLSESGRVSVRIIGKVIDEKYTRMLMERGDLDLIDVTALDKVQKHKPINEDEFKLLKRKKLVEGRRPNLFVSAEVAAATETIVDYLKKRGIDKGYCRQMVVELLRKQRQATRHDFDKLLLTKLSDALDGDQKKNLITNLLQEMRRDGDIRPVGGKRGRGTEWELCNAAPESRP
jgi:ATP-dependent DNA helicase RecG